MSSDVTPQWNARVGDKVWLVVKGKWEKNWTVTQIGFPNEHGYCMNIEISNGKRSFIRPPHNFPIDIIIIPPDKELPKLVAEYAKKWRLGVCRYVGNCEGPNYRFFCRTCLEEVYVRIVSDETCDFGVQVHKGKPRFYQGKPEVEDDHTEVVCECRKKEYERPEEIETYW